MKKNLNEAAALKRDLAEERRISHALIDSSVRLNSMFNLPELLQTIMQTAAALLQAGAASLLLYDEVNKELTFEVAVGDTADQVKTLRMPADKGIAGWVLKNQKPVVVGEVHKDKRFSDSIDRALGLTTHSLLAVPLNSRDRVLGVIEVINKKTKTGCTERDLEVASAFASQAAVAIDNAHLYEKLADTVVQSRMSYRL
jgi:sigma-B regulation protein RsbU (phosphoserine phosphatase)